MPSLSSDTVVSEKDHRVDKVRKAYEAATEANQKVREAYSAFNDVYVELQAELKEGKTRISDLEYEVATVKADRDFLKKALFECCDSLSPAATMNLNKKLKQRKIMLEKRRADNNLKSLNLDDTAQGKEDSLRKKSTASIPNPLEASQTGIPSIVTSLKESILIEERKSVSDEDVANDEELAEDESAPVADKVSSGDFKDPCTDNLAESCGHSQRSSSNEEIIGPQANTKIARNRFHWVSLETDRLFAIYFALCVLTKSFFYMLDALNYAMVEKERWPFQNLFF